MVSPASSPKKTTIAAVLAGLLIVALGTYFAYATPAAAPAGAAATPASASAHDGPMAASAGRAGAPGNAAMNPAANPASNSSANSPANGAATASAATSQPAPAHPPHTKAQAAAALMALPELQAWSALIEKRSAGATHGALIEDDPAPRVVKGKRYWQFSFVENTPDAVLRWESFLIAADGDILIDDVTTDELLTLERWRKEKQPSKRNGPAG